MAAIEKLIGQPIPWAGEPPASTEPEAVHEPAPRHHARGSERSSSRSRHRPAGPRNAERSPAPPRSPERSVAAAPRNPERAPAKPVAKPVRFEDASPRSQHREPNEADTSHLPAFLLRPVKV